MPRKKYWKRSRAVKAAKSVTVVNITTDLVSDTESICAGSIESATCSSIAMDWLDAETEDSNIIFQQLKLNGHFHQGDERFMPNSGRQCTCCALMFLYYAQVKYIHDWTRDDLDNILVQGNEIYSHIQRSSTITAAYLLINELPEYLSAFDTNFRLVRHQAESGMIWPAEGMQQFGGFIALEVALERALTIHGSCFVNFCDAVFSFMLIGGVFYVFDSHSRNVQGTLSCEGTSVLISYSTVHEVYEHCIRLALSMNANANTMFEITPVSIQIDVEDDRHIENIDNESEMQHSVSSDSDAIQLSDNDTVLCNSSVETVSDEGTIASKLSSQRKSYVKKIRERNMKRAKRKNILTDDIITDNDDKYKAQLKRKQDQYSQDLTFKEQAKACSIDKYKKNEVFRRATKKASTEKYHNDTQFRESVKSASTDKYCQNAEFREKVKSASTDKYCQNAEFREKVKSASTDKYRQNTQFRAATKKASVEKYKSSEQFRAQVKKSNTSKRNNSKQSKSEMVHVTEQFRQLISEGPEYVCSVCHRRFFKNQVVFCEANNYIQNFADHLITDTYLHKCIASCLQPCVFISGPSGKSWICHTCHRKLKSGKTPAEAVVNNLQLHDIPKELNCLNKLEQHLVSLNIPFMKLLSLPKGQQNAVHGPTVAVPSNIKQTALVLPREQTSDQLVRVKLKRKLAFKGHYEYQFVNTENVRTALAYLKEKNIYYRDIDFNNDWINPHEVDNDNAVSNSDNVMGDVNDEEITNANQSDFASTSIDSTEVSTDESGLLLDTCLQPVDIGQDILDNNLENIINISPCENNIPTALSTDKSNEAKCFPSLFPTGSPTFHDQREERITLGRYLNTRLMNADGRFARNTDYLFYAQYLAELEQVKSNVQISIRKGTPSQISRKVVSSNLTDKESLTQILKHDEGYKFLKPIRGTPPFWQSVQKDLFAMIRQLGIPTWFCSFSSAELRWTEIIDSILKETEDTRKAKDLDWASKCSILRQNPVTAARMFDRRFHNFLANVIMSPAAPIGKVIDHFYRVEFQQRGSPHTHCLFWVENAPKIAHDSDETVVDFVDSYVSCELPADDELRSIVETVQTHSKRHTQTCRKGGKTCRFNFPRPPSCQTFVCHAESQDTKTIEDLPKDANGNPDMRFFDEIIQPKMSSKRAQEILQRIWDEINKDKQHVSTETLFDEIGVAQSDFEDACAALGKKTTIALKRRPIDVWINQYNPALLKCWNANMDIQYVVDAYSCVVYIISYISKAEREMGLLLAQTEKEARKENNPDAKEALKTIGHTYLTHREVSAQEAVYRVCNLHLKEGSRLVQFVPVGINTTRLSLPLQTIKQKRSSEDFKEEDMWATSLIDRYTHRPTGADMDKLCLAEFSSEYRIVPKAEMSRVNNERRRTPVLTLQKGLGYMQKRTNTKPAVIRYPRFSQSKDSEKYHHSILQLFLPYRVDTQLKPPGFESFEQFYESASVKIGSITQFVKKIVDENKHRFEKDADELEMAEEILQSAGSLEDAWSQICPETEMERQECEDQRQNLEEEEDDTDNIPDLQRNDNRTHETVTVSSSLSKGDARKMLQSLNSEQASIFYMVRQWALEKRNGLDPQPFHLCVHGPGGTGKSLLIKAINYEVNRLLAKCRLQPDDISVILTAPTGVAAFNIDAQTIHSALSIGIESYLPYIPLGEDKINTLRHKFQSVQLLIIDEISMVDHKLLAYIHGRLKQIKQTPNDVPFGNVSILAVGDFYQLPPVKGRPLLADNVGVDHWNDIFVKAELTQIMRQRNQMFAEMLNRLRLRNRKTSLQPEDIITLESRQTGEVVDCIHIFPKNCQVDAFNQNMLHSKCDYIHSIEAEDICKQRKTNVAVRKRMCGSFALPKTISIGIGARVMLTRNIDTGDGLVNGVFGSVSNFQFKENEEKPSKVFIQFDNAKVGTELRKKTQFPANVSNTSSPIEMVEETARNGAGHRRQFPLKLAWACTVHKTQGLTFDNIVVSFDGIRTPGQAYVALSRVTSLEGLVVENFDQDKIYCNDQVTEALANMPIFDAQRPAFQPTSELTLILHNVQGLDSHFNCLKNDARIVKGDVICITETWISSPTVSKDALPSYNFHHQNRASSYDHSSRMFSNFKTQSHGGVGAFVKDNLHVEMNMIKCNIEHLCMYIHDYDIALVLVYRPPTYQMSIFKTSLAHLIQQLNETYRCGLIILGDFNENIRTSSSIPQFLGTHGFIQSVTEATTEDNTIIDHVYSRNIQDVSVNIIPTFFSHHEAVQINVSK